MSATSASVQLQPNYNYYDYYEYYSNVTYDKPYYLSNSYSYYSDKPNYKYFNYVH